MSTSLSVVPAGRAPRRRYPLEYKRQVVQESLSPGASIAGVALAHGINANMLHNWRWQYRRGDFGALSSMPTFVPVHVAPDSALSTIKPNLPARRIDGQADARFSEIELVFNAARVVIRGAPDPATLRCVIDALRP